VRYASCSSTVTGEKLRTEAREPESSKARKLESKITKVKRFSPQAFQLSGSQAFQLLWTTVLTPRPSNNPYNVIIIRNHDRLAG